MYNNLLEVLDLNTNKLSIKDLKLKLEQKNNQLPIIFSDGNYLTTSFENYKGNINSVVLNTTKDKNNMIVQDLIDILTILLKGNVESFPKNSLVNVNEDTFVQLEGEKYICDVLEIKNHLFLMIKGE